MLIKEAYSDSLQYEESSLAHYIHHLLAEKKISLDDDISKLNFHQANHQKDFVFIFALSEEEAIHYYRKTFHQRPRNCHEHLLDFQFYRGKEVISFRDMRKECDSFPAIAG
jgi:hypothetical protein